VGKIKLTPPKGGNSCSDLSASGGKAERELAEKYFIMKVKNVSALISCKLSDSAINNILGGYLTGVTTSGGGNATNPSCGCVCRYSADQLEWDTNSPNIITLSYLWGTTLASDNVKYPVNANTSPR
jgi:hypothetical protein